MNKAENTNDYYFECADCPSDWGNNGATQVYAHITHTNHVVQRLIWNQDKMQYVHDMMVRP